MTDLVKQPSAMPTRKMVAVIVTGAIVGGIGTALNIFAPDADFAPLLEMATPAITALVMAVAGYMTKERA